MTLLLVLVWAVTLGLSVRAAVGPRHWHRWVVAPAKPGLGDPTDAGLSWPALRNGVLRLAAVAVAVVLTLRVAPPSERELHEATEVAVGLDVTGAVTAGLPEDASTIITYLEVRAGHLDETIEEIGDGPVVCVEVQRVETTEGRLHQEYVGIGAERCDA